MYVVGKKLILQAQAECHVAAKIVRIMNILSHKNYIGVYLLVYLLAFYHKSGRFGTWNYSNELKISENNKQYPFVCFRLNKTVASPASTHMRKTSIKIAERHYHSSDFQLFSLPSLP